jgi:pimeloyl-ACP methyl ester carboxylesterase
MRKKRINEQARDNRGRSRRRLKMTPVIKSVELPNKVTLQYVEQGSLSGTPVLLLHGVTDSCHSFDLALPHLPESIHAFALSQRGHGDSSRPEAGYRFHDLAADVAAFMDALHIDAAFIVGHSMGSGVAQRFAIDHPERILGLVFIGSFARLPEHPGVQELWDSAISTLTDPVDPKIVHDFQQSTIVRPVPPAFYETVVQESLKLPARVWRELFGGFLQDDFLGELHKIKAPTLIFWGDQDAFCSRADQDELTSAIAGSRLAVYEGTGHALHWEEPDRFASDLVAFIDEIANRGATGNTPGDLHKNSAE